MVEDKSNKGFKEDQEHQLSLRIKQSINQVVSRYGEG